MKIWFYVTEILFYFLTGKFLKKGSFFSVGNDNYDVCKQKVKEKETILEYL